MYCLSIVFTKLCKLAACYVCTRIHKERRFSSALESERTKLQNLALNHKINKFFLVLFHGYSVTFFFRHCETCKRQVLFPVIVAQNGY